MTQTWSFSAVGDLLRIVAAAKSISSLALTTVAIARAVASVQGRLGHVLARRSWIGRSCFT
jgi:hypothetical protein